MSTTEKQAESNRQNAQHSTGPKTEEGKARVARNAVKHGLYSNHTTLNSRHVYEDRAEYERLVAELEQAGAGSQLPELPQGKEELSRLLVALRLGAR